MPNLNDFILETKSLRVSSETLAAVRNGQRTRLAESIATGTLPHHIAGQLPYFYRTPANLEREFAEELGNRRNALDILYDLTIKMPTTPKFQQSHFGEILAALFLEQIMGLRRLMCKLTLTSSENTNVHKMDGFFVDLSTSPYTFVAVEAKSSILPTELTSVRAHKHGILKHMIESLNTYGSVDERFDFTVIRDNLEHFSPEESRRIKAQLFPPGPENMLRLGMAVINECTVRVDDDDYILTEPCDLDFNFRAITVTNLAALAQTSYSKIFSLKVDDDVQH